MPILCPFRRLTGLPCPACGATRALLAASRLDFGRAFALNPILPLAALLLCARTVQHRQSPAPSLEAVAVIVLTLGLLRASLVAFNLRTPFTAPHLLPPGATDR